MRRTLAVLLLGACSSPAPPGPGSWQRVRPLPVERFEAPAAALDGKLYYLGGITDNCPDGAAACTVADVDVYDPASGEWTAGPALPADSARHHLAIAVLDGRLWVLGGFTGILGIQQFLPVPATYVLDAGTWQRRADQPLARGAATAQAIDGRIYVAGGGTQEPDSRSELFVYDPSTDQWSARQAMPTAREHLASCTIGGKLVAIGGWAGADRTAVAAVESYDPAADQWRSLPALPTARGGLAATVLGGVCYVIGGEDWALPLPGTFTANEGFDPAGGRWYAFAALPAARHGIGVAAVGPSLFVVGGGPSQGNSYTAEVDLFTPSP